MKPMIKIMKTVNPLQLLDLKDGDKKKIEKDDEPDEDDFKLETKEGLFSAIDEIKVIASGVLFTVDETFDLIEKLEKLLTWQDQGASTIVLAVILIAFFVVTFIPLRMIIILWLTGKFGKGSTWY